MSYLPIRIHALSIPELNPRLFAVKLPPSPIIFDGGCGLKSMGKMAWEVLSGWLNMLLILGAFLLSFHEEELLELLQSRSLISYRLKKTLPENHLDFFFASER